MLAAPAGDDLDPGLDRRRRLGAGPGGLDLDRPDERVGPLERDEVVDAERDAGDLRRILDEDRDAGGVRNRREMPDPGGPVES